MPQKSNKVNFHEDTPLICYSATWSDSGGYWDTTYRVTNTYDVNGKITEKITEPHWFNGFQPGSKIRWFYDQLDRVSKSSNSYWNGNNWQLSSEDHTGWDSQDNVTSSTHMGWNSGVWDTLWADRTSYQYVFGNRVSNMISETWNETWRFWDTVRRQEFHYPTAAGWDTTVSYDYNQGAWQLDERFVDVNWYDFELGLATNMTLQQPNTQGNFENVARGRCTYGTNNNSHCVYDTWSGQLWDSTGLELINYDSHEHLTLHEEFSWIGTWYQDYGFMVNNVYDSLGRTEQRIYQEFDGYIYRLSSKETCTEFMVNREEQQILEASVSAFPNPCTDKLNFRWEQTNGGPVEITLTDMQGRIRTRTTANVSAGQGELTMYLSETLPAGIYGYSLRTRQGSTSGKVSIAR
ncbi:MAG: T9SS type A sorting domain-containing protein [Bacteroidia bacterium]